MTYTVTLELFARAAENTTEQGRGLNKAVRLKDLVHALDELVAREIGNPAKFGKRTAEGILAEAIEGSSGRPDGKRISGEEEIQPEDLWKILRAVLDKPIRELPPQYREKAKTMTDERLSRLRPQRADVEE